MPRDDRKLLTPPTDAELLRVPGVLPENLRNGRNTAAVVRRTVLHEWPLSRVELAELAELAWPNSAADPGLPVRRVVKSQLCVSSVEAAFYRIAYARGEARGEAAEQGRGRALSDGIRLPGFLGASWSADLETDWLILSCEEGEPASWDGLTDEQIRSRVRELSRAFQVLADGAPVFTDWSRHERFAADMDRIFPVLLDGEDGAGLDGASAAELRAWIEGPAGDCWDSPVGLLHGDLKADNLIRTGARETVVLDWQRPMKAPLPLEEELSLLLENRSPAPAADPTPFRRLACLTLCHWYAWAFRTCLPVPFVRSMAVHYASL